MSDEPEANMKTQWIAGHRLTLEAGVRHRAGRPILTGPRKQTFTVSIYDFIDDVFSPIPVETVRGLTYEQANELLNEFNNGATSFDGRVW